MTPPCGHRVRVITRTWPDAPHWEYDAVFLGEDEHGTWLGVPADTLIARPGRRFAAACSHLVLIPNDAWWFATLYGDDPARPFDTYVDITTPCRWSSSRDEVRCVDLDLDVVRDNDGAVFLDDDDEFEVRRIALDYPPDVVDSARHHAAKVLVAVEAETGPFGAEVRRTWLQRLAAAH